MFLLTHLYIPRYWKRSNGWCFDILTLRPRGPTMLSLPFLTSRWITWLHVLWILVWAENWMREDRTPGDGFTLLEPNRFILFSTPESEWNYNSFMLRISVTEQLSRVMQKLAYWAYFWLNISQDVSLGDFLLAPTCPMENGTLWFTEN